MDEQRVVRWLRMRVVAFAMWLNDVSGRIMRRFDRCYICGEEALHWCESCGQRMCFDCTSADWNDCDICESCDAALEACGAKAECRMEEEADAD